MVDSHTVEIVTIINNIVITIVDHEQITRKLRLGRHFLANRLCILLSGVHASFDLYPSSIRVAESGYPLIVTSAFPLISQNGIIYSEFRPAPIRESEISN